MSIVIAGKEPLKVIIISKFQFGYGKNYTRDTRISITISSPNY